MALCRCGCGQQAGIAAGSNSRRAKGAPNEFLNHHQLKGARSPIWRGGVVESDGYRYIRRANPKESKSAYSAEHVLVAEQALGKKLPARAVVHHVNENRSDNSGENLVICENQAYHLLLHYRANALAASGNANWKRCKVCKQWDDPSHLKSYKDGQYERRCHRECIRDANRRRRERLAGL